jgi:hypothetical protein
MAGVSKVYSAAKAFIKIDNKMAGYIRAITFAENINRVNVQGLGNVKIQEAPVVSLNNTWTVDQFFLDFKQPIMQAMMNRMGSVQAILDTLVLGELGFQIAMYAKTIVSRDDTTKLITQADPTGQSICQLGPCYPTTQQFSLSDQGIAGWNVSGIYIDPVSAVNL